MHSLWLPKMITIVTANIIDHRSPYKGNNNVKVEIFQQLPICDTETRSEPTLLEKHHQQTCSMLDYYRLSICEEKNK
jgi:hypothetical protein